MSNRCSVKLLFPPQKSELEVGESELEVDESELEVGCVYAQAAFAFQTKI